MSCRVLVTGVSAVTPFGNGVDGLWRGVVSGEVATGQVTRLAVERYGRSRGGQVCDFDPAPYTRRLDPKHLQRATQYAIAASCDAVDDAGLTPGDFEQLGARACVFMGTVMGNRRALELPDDRTRGGERERRESVNQAWLAVGPAIELGIRGGAVTLPAACAAGNCAVSRGWDEIRRGACDVAVVGGADELCEAMFMMFAQFGSLAPDVVRPFDKHRRGLLLSEGAAALVLEREAHARARGVVPYGCIAGYGLAADAHDLVHPDPEGRGASSAMQHALRTAELSAADVQYVCAHGTGTLANDPAEARAIRETFGVHADALAVSSVKSTLGHAQGAATAIELVVCLLAIRHGTVPPTANHIETDPRCNIDVVPNSARSLRINAALSNGFGLGGCTSCIAVTVP